MRFGPGGAATAPPRPGATTTVQTSRRPEELIIAIIRRTRSKSRPGTDLPDTSDRCLSRLLSTGPRLGAAGTASGESSARSSPRWGGAETKHGVQVEEPPGKSFRGGALAPCLALESSWKAQTRVFGRHRGVSRNRSDRAGRSTYNDWCRRFSPVSSAPPSARPVGLVGQQEVGGGYLNSIH